MINIEDILRELQAFKNTRPIERGRLCGACVVDFMPILKNMSIECDFIIVYHEPIIPPTNYIGDLKENYLTKLMDNDIVGADAEIRNWKYDKNERYTHQRNIHALIEALIGKEKWIIDPSCGLIYNQGKENLCRGIGVYESYYYLNQIEYFYKNRNYHTSSFLYANQPFWESVYHISYNTRGDLPLNEGDLP